MSVLHTLQLVPASGTTKSLKDISAFISNLDAKGFIEKEFSILSGPQEYVQGISTWDFRNHEIKSPLTGQSKLQIVEAAGPEELSPEGNYAFKVHLSKNCPYAAYLDVFVNTERKHIPLFICFLSSTIDLNVAKQDPESDDFTETAVTGINCLITADGRNTESLWQLAEQPDVFPEFFEEVKHFLGAYETGSFYG